MLVVPQLTPFVGVLLTLIILFDMDKNHLKLIIKNLKTVIEELEAEVYSDPTSYVEPNGKSVTYADQEEM
tara:strand:- start:501 stop:710 length:210 start_codon:yes stop_codon:yes gene_type:complete